MSFAEGVKTRLRLAVLWIRQHQERDVKEDLLCFGHRYTMPLIFSRVAIVPIKADDCREIGHVCILS